MDVLAAPRVAFAGDTGSRGWVAVEDGRIAAVGTGDGWPSDARVTRLHDGVLAPGLVDLQVNGAFGTDFADADTGQWREILTRLPSTGVTSVVPTFITAAVADLADALTGYRRLRGSLDAVPGAARTLGVHLEGPFLSERRRGAHEASLLCDPAPAHVDRLLEAGADGALLYVTLAPERPGGLDAIRRFVAAGVRVAVGHSDATDRIVRAAADAGATMVTHLYNAQRPLHHRDPGVVGAALADPRLVLGMIVDLHHVEPTAVRVAFAAAGGRVALVTDAVAALGMPQGRYQLGGQVIDVLPDRPPLRLDGAIAGSSLRLDDAVANAVSCGVALPDALEAATRVPADAIGRPDLGRLSAGAAADLVWLSDELRTRATWVAGHLAYADDDAAPLLTATTEVSH
jgi:N-acetylglucosamine-6-phosphate deacetylase